MVLSKMFSFFIADLKEDIFNTQTRSDFTNITEECFLYICQKNTNQQFHSYIDFLSKDLEMTKHEVIEYLLDEEE